MHLQKNILIILLSIGSILLGYIYANELYGVLEFEVQLWGYFSMVLGIFFLILLFISIQGKFARLVLYMCMAIQIPPIILWFIFHGSRITDAPSTVSDHFLGHWAFSIPHVIFFSICFYMLKQIKQDCKSRGWKNSAFGK